MKEREWIILAALRCGELCVEPGLCVWPRPRALCFARTHATTPVVRYPRQQGEKHLTLHTLQPLQCSALLKPPALEPSVHSEWWDYYSNKVCSLTAFSDYAPLDALLSARGGFTLLSADLRQLLLPLQQQQQEEGKAVQQREGEGAGGGPTDASGDGGDIGEASSSGRSVVGGGSVGTGGSGGGSPQLDHISADLHGSMAGWQHTVSALLLCCAGLVKYCIDEYPPGELNRNQRMRDEFLLFLLSGAYDVGRSWSSTASTSTREVRVCVCGLVW